MSGVKWEQIGPMDLRCRVPGGWVLKTLSDVFIDKPDSGMVCGWEFRDAICFIPDPEHT